MITVDIIRPERLSAGTGIATIVKKLNDNKHAFEKYGIDINVFAVPETDAIINNEKKNSLKKEIVDGVRKKIYALAKYFPFIAKWIISRRIKDSSVFIDYYLSLNRNPDVVEVDSPKDAYIYLNKRTNKRPKLVVFFHSDGIPLEMYRIYFPCLYGTKFWNYMYECDKYVSENADTRVFITSIGLQNYLKYFPAAANKKNATVVNGIEDLPEEKRKRIDNNPKSSDYKYQLCCTGTVVNRKGQYIVIEALRQIKREALKKINIIFIGDGPDRKKLEKKVIRYHLEKHVQFLGKIDNSKVNQYLLESDIYVLMSLNEGLPMSILEAMRCSKPIISTNVSGIPETVDNNYNGILLQPDPKELVSLLNNIDTYDWEEMGKNSRNKYLRQFTDLRNREDYCKMIKQTINE